MFNLVEACRVTKKQGQEEDFDEACKRCYGVKEEMMSEIWTEEEDGEGRNTSLLIVRLMYDGATHPWLVAHQGIHEIIRATLFVPAVASKEGEGTVLCVFLRDHARRGDNAIKRKFYLKFSTSVEADSFKYAHNRMIEAHQGQICEGRIQEARRMLDKVEKNKKRSSKEKDISNFKNGADFEEKDEGNWKSPPHKKRRVEEEIQKEKNEERRSTTEDETAERIALLNNDTSAFSAVDNAFECTQDPFFADY